MVKNARTLTISKFFKVLSIIAINDLGANNMGSPKAKIKKAIRSKRSCGKSNMKIW